MWAGLRSRYSDWLRAVRVRGSNSGGGEIFRTWGPTSLLYNGYRVFPGSKERPGRDADPSPPSSAVVMKEYSYTSTKPLGRTACTEPQCLYKGALYLHLTILIIKQKYCERFNPYPTAFPYGNGMVLHFYQQQESSTTKTVHKVINKGLKTYV